MDFGQLFTNVLNEMLGPTAIAYALAAIGLNIHFGLTGLINMGQAGFMLLGAYGFAVATVQGAPLWLAFVVAIALSVVFALLLGLPTLKLRGDYLAIVTIAAAEIVRMIGRSTALTDVTGGSEGLTGNAFKHTFQDASPFPDERWTLGPLTLATNTSNSWWLRIVGWTLVLLACLLVWRLIRSPWGRVLKGIREDEDAVRALGKNVYGYKLQALVLGGVFGALGGIVFVLASSVQADSLGRPVTFNTWTILLLGGAATVLGPVLGSLLFWGALVFVRGFLRGIVPADALSVQQIEQIGWVLVGLTLMALIVFRPQGILGDKKELAINAR
ncbi:MULTISPECIES: branched-chain amino acid ABC transporter permease [Cellulomonas]|jgi:branched-chain amino acid transport system permease protein|uniref:branched-chain amino acid ABC transporter permease n=1 Tax=Cellulomonas TaxID=1707 RepID=UPI000626E643|nr:MULTISPECIES: branched-chain amino acid ABC transporter permease [Cellulomonas]MBO9567496.1 branched-chain amino acid ABC transporter permease [Cellulomonas iranensis]TFH74496.1 branched-chain amino acid ABC transporter permease [Cellulomonas sp. HD19AZ1]UCN16260.1 branched-chain amino acid ABC transporter permease [Cellulomonas iranensis]